MNKETEYHLLYKNKYFCMAPWVHLFTENTGEAKPCCHADWRTPVGNTKTDSLEKIWSDTPLQQIRQNMLDGLQSDACKHCYEVEDSGFEGPRRGFNKNYRKYISAVDGGINPKFKLRYANIMFSNHCNFSCRMCKPTYSSAWYDEWQSVTDQKPYGTKIIHAGRSKYDLVDQIIEHIDTIETYYFNGGEPTLMEQHWKLLWELEKQEKFDVTLIYNTNFQQLDYKKHSITKLWNKFKHVSVGASLDLAGTRAELVRKGTVWSTIETNRERMLQECPDVEFTLSATMSIFNILHFSDFHREWSERGLIEPRQIQLKPLQAPMYYRMDVLPQHLKQQATQKIKDHITWLETQPATDKVIDMYQSCLTFMHAQDNSHLLPEFNRMTKRIDNVRGENFYSIFPELLELNNE
jgi:MoaA/NifB/PqqE/SkfB family radical SAM enzyme